MELYESACATAPAVQPQVCPSAESTPAIAVTESTSLIQTMYSDRIEMEQTVLDFAGTIAPL